MCKIKFFFKINIKKNKKKLKHNNIGFLLLISFLFKNSKIQIKNIFTNKFMMIRAPFHYKVSKKIIYNKQSCVQLTLIFNKKFNYIFFKKLNLFNYSGINLYKITTVNKI